MHGPESPCEQIQRMRDTRSSGKVVKRVSLSKGKERYVGANATRVCVCKKRTHESCSESEKGSRSRSEMDRVGFRLGIR